MASAGEGQIETLVTFLEMTEPPARAPLPPPSAGIEVRRALRPTVSFYRYLYDAIGKDWTWYERKLLGDAELATIIHDPRVEVNVLWVDGVPAGLAELDRRDLPDVELAYFGIVPEFIGQGLGRFLLDWSIHHAWRAWPRRFWVHTCDLDHPRALEVYQKAGFRIYDRQTALATPPS
jgi:GNAT superfamily N-acetyltransferase